MKAIDLNEMRRLAEMAEVGACATDLDLTWGE